MILIAHRGNTHGPKPLLENNPGYIDAAIKMGYDVEIDVRKVEEKYYLGHDFPVWGSQTSFIHPVDVEWLIERKEHLWVHCKNNTALAALHVDLHTFFHDTDDYTLTSQNYIWAYPGKIVPSNSRAITVAKDKNYPWEEQGFAGVCSDYIASYREDI